MAPAPGEEVEAGLGDGRRTRRILGVAIEQTQAARRRIVRAQRAELLGSASRLATAEDHGGRVEAFPNCGEKRVAHAASRL